LRQLPNNITSLLDSLFYDTNIAGDNYLTLKDFVHYKKNII